MIWQLTWYRHVRLDIILKIRLVFGFFFKNVLFWSKLQPERVVLAGNLLKNSKKTGQHSKPVNAPLQLFINYHQCYNQHFNITPTFPLFHHQHTTCIHTASKSIFFFFPLPFFFPLFLFCDKGPTWPLEWLLEKDPSDKVHMWQFLFVSTNTQFNDGQSRYTHLQSCRAGAFGEKHVGKLLLQQHS